MGMWLETQALPPDLAGVLALFPNTGTHHGVCDVAWVGRLTLLVLDDGDVGASQGMGQVHCGNGMKGCGKRGPQVPFPTLLCPLCTHTTASPCSSCLQPTHLCACSNSTGNASE